MKIVFLVSSMHAGGAERVAATLASAWAERGDEVTLVATYSGRGECFYPLSDKVKILWLADALGPKTHPFIYGPRKLMALRRLLRQEQADVIVSFLTNVNVTALIASRGLGQPIIVCERTNPAFSSSSGALLRRLRRITYPCADLVTLQAEESVATFKKMVPRLKGLAVVPNPMPPPLLDATLADPIEPAQGRFRLMAMGRLVPDKQFSILINAFAAVADKYPQWDLVVWGDGPLRETLTEQINHLGLGARVTLPGRTAEPWKELAGSHAFAMSSVVEGFPNVLLEAMALGLPCITFDCPSGPREMTRDGRDALLIPLGDEDAYRRGLAKLLAEPALRSQLGRQAAQSVRERYTLTAVLARWDELFARVTKTSSPTE